LRPGEKLFEELITAGEGVLETGHDKIMVLRSDRNPVEDGAKLKALLAAAGRFEVGSVRRGLEDLVPEYSPVSNAPR